MTLRILPPLLVAVMLTACGTTGAPTAGPRAATGLAAAGAHVSGTAALKAFERMPSLGLEKKAAPIRFEPIMDPAPGLPESLV